MSEPLRLPEPIKALGRAIRDNRLANDLITRLIRTLARGARRARLAHRAPRLGFADVAMPNGQRLKLFAAQSESVHSSIFYEGWTGEEIEVLPVADRMPTIVLSSTQPATGETPAFRTLAAQLQNEIATAYVARRHDFVPDSGHYIQRD